MDFRYNTCSWQYNDSASLRFLYEDDESMSLVIKNVTAADAGEYLVTASNELGEDSTTMHLVVKQPPKIKKIENQNCMVSNKLDNFVK